MLTRNLLLLLLVVFGFIATSYAQRPTSCEDIECPAGYRCREERGRPQCVALNCPTYFEPVCGVDGNTYFNLCFLSLSGVDYGYDGECRVELWDPIDGVQPLDEEESEGEIEEIEEEEGEFVYDEFVAEEEESEIDGPAVEYDEEGEAQEEEYFVEEGEIIVDEIEELYPVEEEQQGEEEEFVFDPVEETYPEQGDEEEYQQYELPTDEEVFNPLPVEEQQGEKEEYQQYELPTDEEVFNPLPVEDQFEENGCPNFFAPVCGKSGETYFNACFLAFAGDEFDYEGECQQ